jgi:membrane-associated protease RseP (regulator of RpoE activity)
VSSQPTEQAASSSDEQASSQEPSLQSADGPRWALPILLFVLTCLSTTWVGAKAVHEDKLTLDTLFEVLPLLIDGIPFSASLMAILLSHEMGHFILARRHRVPASLPYFVPVPIALFGTLGAVIAMPPTKDRNALVDIGAAGPLAGLVVALPILVYGLTQSEIVTRQSGVLQEGNSLLYLGLKYLVTGHWLPGNGLDIALGPVAQAGWVGLLVTMLNLLPVGQLDGGHIAYAFFGRRQDTFSLWLHRGLLPLAGASYSFAVWDLWRRGVALSTASLVNISVGLSWVVWWFLLTVFRRMGGGYHPPTDDCALSPWRRRLCIAMLGLFGLLFTPIPLRPFLLPKGVSGSGIVS